MNNIISWKYFAVFTINPNPSFWIIIYALTSVLILPVISTTLMAHQITFLGRWSVAFSVSTKASHKFLLSARHISCFLQLTHDEYSTSCSNTRYKTELHFTKKDDRSYLFFYYFFNYLQNMNSQFESSVISLSGGTSFSFEKIHDIAIILFW